MLGMRRHIHQCGSNKSHLHPMSHQTGSDRPIAARLNPTTGKLEMPEPMTEDEYVQAEGERCPACRSENIWGLGPAAHDISGASMPFVCDACHATWLDCYEVELHLEGYHALRMPKHDEESEPC